MYINAVQSYFSPPIGAVYLLAVLWKRSNEKVSFIRFSSMFHFYTPCTAWKWSVFGAFLLRIFRHSDGIRRDMKYLSVFSPNAEKYGPEKLRIRTLFTQCWKCQKTKCFLTFPRGIEMEQWAILGIYKTVKCKSPKVVHYHYQRRIQNLVKHLRGSFFAKTLNGFQFCLTSIWMRIWPLVTKITLLIFNFARNACLHKSDWFLSHCKPSILWKKWLRAKCLENSLETCFIYCIWLY